MDYTLGTYYPNEDDSWVQKCSLVGPQGPSGTNHLSTREVEGNLVNVQVGGENESIATCDGDSVLTEGGFIVHPDLKVTQNHQRLPNEWYVEAINEGPSPSPMVSFATCVTIGP